MANELVASAHTVGESNFHLLLTPAYRRAVFRAPLLQELTIAYIKMKLDKFRVQLLAYNFGPDHLHLFIANLRFVGEAELVRQIKGFSSFMLRKGHSHLFADLLWGDKFWSEGHFYRSVGAVNKKTVQHYIEECQEKHWQKVRQQQTLLAFA